VHNFPHAILVLANFHNKDISGLKRNYIHEYQHSHRFG
jgi:hypothetical protein